MDVHQEGIAALLVRCPLECFLLKKACKTLRWDVGRCRVMRWAASQHSSQCSNDFRPLKTKMISHIAPCFIPQISLKEKSSASASPTKEKQHPWEAFGAWIWRLPFLFLCMVKANRKTAAPEDRSCNPAARNDPSANTFQTPDCRKLHLALSASLPKEREMKFTSFLWK